jgi:hypothetical protein
MSTVCSGAESELNDKIDEKFPPSLLICPAFEESLRKPETH